MGVLYLLDCMSTVPLMMISKSSMAHSVVCWVLRCTVSNMPPTCQGHNEPVRWLRGQGWHLGKAHSRTQPGCHFAQLPPRASRTQDLLCESRPMTTFLAPLGLGFLT